LSANDDNGVLLHMEEHTRAKHRILEEYLKAWFPILATFDNRIIFLDGFAGSGEYDDEHHSPGSPIVAIQTALNHSLFPQKLSTKELIFLLVEKLPERSAHLKGRMNILFKEKAGGKYEVFPQKWTAEVITGEFSKETGPLIEGLEKKGLNLAPTMAFIDPFGYKDLNLDLLGRILRFPKCELLITYMTGFVDRFCYDAMHEDSIKQTLKIDDQVLDRVRAIKEPEKRDLEWLKLLNDGIVGAATRQADAVKAPLGRIYRLSFKLKDRGNHIMYDLVYFTKDLRGIDVMKAAMYKVNKDWNYTFSDYNFSPGQTKLFDFSNEVAWISDAAALVYLQFKGRKLVPFFEVQNYVRDPSVPYAFRKGILKALETEMKVIVHRGASPKGSFPENCFLDFN
jgi:three-Cys-motif partner protein